MSLKSVFLSTLIITIILVIFVNQQIEMVKLSYKLWEKEKHLNAAVDQNRILMYNNASLRSPKYLTGMLRANAVDLKYPDTDAVTEVKITEQQETQVAKATPTWKNKLYELIVPKVEAASKTGQ